MTSLAHSSLHKMTLKRPRQRTWDFKRLFSESRYSTSVADLTYFLKHLFRGQYIYLWCTAVVVGMVPCLERPSIHVWLVVKHSA